jgi:hypothetical protein
MMEEVSVPETSDYFQETTQRHIPEGCHILTEIRSWNLSVTKRSLKTLKEETTQMIQA